MGHAKEERDIPGSQLPEPDQAMVESHKIVQTLDMESQARATSQRATASSTDLSQVGNREEGPSVMLQMYTPFDDLSEPPHNVEIPSYTGPTEPIAEVSEIHDNEPIDAFASQTLLTGADTDCSQDGSLPANDGMSMLRKRILAIHRTKSSSAEKASRVHQLMTEKYNSSQASLSVSRLARARSPASLASCERPYTPASASSVDNSIQHASPPVSILSAAGVVSSFNLSQSDLEPTYYQRPANTLESVDSEGAKPNEQCFEESDDAPRPLGCLHYKRNIKLQCSACDRWYTCRFCHDEAEDHSLNRRKTRNMLCMFCGFAQPASGRCVNCNVQSARYYCDVCKLWDDDPAKSIYHCNDCGICRVGQGPGKDFYHCKVCQWLCLLICHPAMLLLT